MKKLIYILTVSVYFILTVGMTITMHICGDFVTSVQLLPFNSEKNLCCCDEGLAKNDCCKNEIKPIQLKVEQISGNIFKLLLPTITVPVYAEFVGHEIYSAKSVYTFVLSYSPPQEVPTFILNQSLLI